MTAPTVDCPACVGWGRFHMARCTISPGGRVYAHTVQSDATERSATVDETHGDGPGSDAGPEDRRQDHPTETGPVASAYPRCVCTLTIRTWTSGRGWTSRYNNPLCDIHGDAA